jgi:hypothetical protein
MQALPDSVLRGRIEAAVLRVAAELRRNPQALNPHGGFASGPAGGALFLAYANQAFPQQGFDADACDLLQQAAAALDGAARPYWIDGFPSNAWATDLAASLLPQAGVAIALEEHDARLLEAIEAGAVEATNYDPLHGWGGVLTYAAQRPDSELGPHIGATAYNYLAQTSSQDADGTYWRELPEHFAPASLREFGSPEVRMFMEDTLAHYPHGRCNLGVAHGTPGVIGALSAALHARCVPPESAQLLSGACDWLLAQRRHAASHRSAFANNKEDDGDSRHAWCYGDPGACLQLFHAAKVLARPDLAAAAHEIALLAAQRDAESGQVFDAGLCHGSAGLAQIFSRAFQYTGDPLLAASAQRWLAHTLDLQQPAEADKSFLFFGEGGVMKPAAGVLEGSAGVGLALLAAIDGRASGWDRAMLMSI